MFEILRNVDSAVANDAAYRISLRIREREHFRNWRKWLPLRPDDRLFPGSIRVATRVLQEIERQTGKRLGDLGDAELRPFQRQIDDIMDERMREEYPDPDGVGKRLLEELRRDYGDGGYRAVA
ncbi:hypothetical protein [Longimicrobium sp.]|uniref:hypothetical protein n=1 Tax=Longimicrobium sp. TaxID=2029185 RepID=UPI002E365CE0|nr:hypothetical protein [Longimicrobium sp.]HEX6039789.1 hypothetical protein [Longimicrobium sp.]